MDRGPDNPGPMAGGRPRRRPGGDVRRRPGPDDVDASDVRSGEALTLGEEGDHGIHAVQVRDGPGRAEGGVPELVPVVRLRSDVRIGNGEEAVAGRDAVVDPAGADGHIEVLGPEDRRLRGGEPAQGRLARVVRVGQHRGRRLVELEHLVGLGVRTVVVQVVGLADVDAGREGELGARPAVHGNAPVGDQEMHPDDVDLRTAGRGKAAGDDSQRNLSGPAMLWPGEHELGDSVPRVPGPLEGRRIGYVTRPVWAPLAPPLRSQHIHSGQLRQDRPDRAGGPHSTDARRCERTMG